MQCKRPQAIIRGVGDRVVFIAMAGLILALFFGGCVAERGWKFAVHDQETVSLDRISGSLALKSAE
jgi:hypothetical protein